MRSLFATLRVLLVLSSSCFAMQIDQYTMPNREVLSARLEMFKPLIEHTDLIAQVADKRLDDCNVIWELDLAFYDQLEWLRRKGLNKTELRLYREQLEANRPFLISALLQDFPKVLNIIRKTGYYKPMIF